MKKMKKMHLVFFITVVAFVLFTAAIAGAVCSSTCTPDGATCVASNGFQIQIVTDANGNFPATDPNGNSVFAYNICEVSGSKNISHVDILLPACTPGLPACNPSTPTSPCANFLTTNPSSSWYPAGVGDSSTGFGLGLTATDTLVWNLSGVTGGTVSLALPGKAPSSPNAMLIKFGNAGYSYGQILAPSCGATMGASSPSVPLSIRKVVNFKGIDICMESPDQSGCPTAIYSCCNTAVDSSGQCTSGYSSSPCGCPSPNKQSFTAGIYTGTGYSGIGQGHLRLLGTLGDSQCPATLLDQESIPCTKSVIVNGVPKTYTYSTTPPCCPYDKIWNSSLGTCVCATGYTWNSTKTCCFNGSKCY